MLDHADLTLTARHSVVITGRSGSGKSTLFRALAGIWPFGRGESSCPRTRSSCHSAPTSRSAPCAMWSPIRIP